MGLFDGSNSSSSSTTSLPDWAAPTYQAYLQRATQVSDLPYQQYTGQLVAGMTDPQMQGLQAMQQRAMQGNPLMSGAQSMLQDTTGGGYLGAQAAGNQNANVQNPYAQGNNPYLQQMVDATASDTLRNYNLSVRPQMDALDARSGSFGNSGVQQMQLEGQRQLAQTLGNQAATIYGNDYAQRAQLNENAANRQFQAGQSLASAQNSLYDSERNRQLQSAGMAPTFAANDYTDIGKLYGVGQQLQSQQQAELDANYGQFQNAQNYPVQRLQLMGNALGMNFGNSTTTTQNPGSSSTASRALAGYLLGNQLGGSNSNGGYWGAALGLLSGG